MLSITCYGQDILLHLNGKEIPCILDKVDTFFVFYRPLGQVKQIEKSYIRKITHDSIYMKDGSIIKGVFDRELYDIQGPYVYYREIRPGTVKDRYNYFSGTKVTFDSIVPYQDSITYTQVEKLMYAQDSTHKKFEFSVEEQRAYTYGRRSARKNFTSPWSTLGGIASGFAGGVILHFFYSSLPALGYVAINSAIKPKMGITDKRDEPYLKDEFFIEGYRSQARILKVKNSVLGAVPALGVGILIRYFSTVH